VLSWWFWSFSVPSFLRPTQNVLPRTPCICLCKKLYIAFPQTKCF
jgi:hypothetical protein